jgi:Xaa-Pro dipeptidase
LTRWERLAHGLERLGCSAALLVGTDHAVHLARYARLYSGPVALVMDRDGARTLVVPVYELDVARERAGVERVVGYGEPQFGLDPRPEAALADAVAALLPAGTIGLADDGSGVGGAALATAGRHGRPIDELVAAVRLVKDDDEHRMLARAYELALVAQETVAAGAAPGMREIDLYSAAHAAAQEAAGGPIEFTGDLLTGVRGGLVCGPVAVAGTTSVAAGDAIVCDLSVRHAGYWGDTARTPVVDAGDELLAARAAVTAILDETAALLRPDVVAADVFASMREALLARFPDGRFPHHGGHGIGVTALEDPHLIPSDRSRLQAGMVLAVEPGIYFDGRFGVRMENMYLVTPDGGLDLRRLP